MAVIPCHCHYRFARLSPRLAVTSPRVRAPCSSQRSPPLTPSKYLGTQWGLTHVFCVTASVWTLPFGVTELKLAKGEYWSPWVGNVGWCQTRARLCPGTLIIRTWHLMALVLLLSENWLYLPTIPIGFFKVMAVWCSGIIPSTLWTKRKERTSLFSGHIEIPREGFWLARICSRVHPWG